jgi:hypothetical protein
MKKSLKLGAIVVGGLLLLSGCRTAAIYNVENDPIEVKLSQDKVYQAIKMAGNSKGWIITQVKPGLALGKLNLRTHQAIVEIPYTSDSFSIKYKNSLNLKYDAETNQIHNNYNGWIQTLENAINFQLSVISE